MWDLMDWYGTDKGYHGYAERYEELLQGFVRPTLLEIGVLNGSSLQVWRDYLPGSTIVGFDLQFPKGIPAGTRFFQGNQGCIPDLVQCERTFGPFDIVIDDGSHLTPDHITSFNVLYPRLKGNGLYVIEDLNFAPETVEYFKDHPDATLIECQSWLEGTQRMLAIRKSPDA